MNGSASGRCSRPLTLRPTKTARNGRIASAKNTRCRISCNPERRRSPVIRTGAEVRVDGAISEMMEVPHDVQEHRRRIAQRVHPVEHPAVAGDQAAEVLDAEVA